MLQLPAVTGAMGSAEGADPFNFFIAWPRVGFCGNAGWLQDSTDWLPGGYRVLCGDVGWLQDRLATRWVQDPLLWMERQIFCLAGCTVAFSRAKHCCLELCGATLGLVLRLNSSSYS
jgi:hypothetical protein